jgi:hypothetical protein
MFQPFKALYKQPLDLSQFSQFAHDSSIALMRKYRKMETCQIYNALTSNYLNYTHLFTRNERHINYVHEKKNRHELLNCNDNCHEHLFIFCL